MKIVVNGFNVKVSWIRLERDDLRARLSYDFESESWEVESNIEKLEIDYSIENLYGDSYKKSLNDFDRFNFEYFPGNFTDELLEAERMGLSIEHKDFRDIQEWVVKYCFSKNFIKAPEDISYYKMPDLIRNLDKNRKYPITLNAEIIHSYKGFQYYIAEYELISKDEIRIKISLGDTLMSTTLYFDAETLYGSSFTYFFEIKLKKYIESLYPDDRIMVAILCGVISSDIERDCERICGR